MITPVDALVWLKNIADGIGSIKNLHDGWGLIARKPVEHQLRDAEERLLYPHYISRRAWIRLLNALTEIRSERLDLMSRAKFREAIKAIYEIETIINSQNLATIGSPSLTDRLKYIQYSFYIQKDKSTISNILEMDNSYSGLRYFRPSVEDLEEFKSLDGSIIFATPSYAQEIISIEYLCKIIGINIEINVSKSSFLEAADFALNHPPDKNAYIIGVDISCMRMIHEFRGNIAFVDMLGTLRNRLMMPTYDKIYEKGSVFIPFGEKSSAFHYIKSVTGPASGSSINMNNIDEVSAYSTMIGALDPNLANYGVAWSPYWQIICGMGRANLAIGDKLSQQPYSNWLLKLGANPQSISEIDRKFAASIRSTMANLNSHRYIINQLSWEVINKYKIDDVISRILNLKLI